MRPTVNLRNPTDVFVSSRKGARLERPAVQGKGVRVSVVSTLRSSSPMLADELRRQADEFLELADLAPEIARPHAGGAGYD